MCAVAPLSLRLAVYNGRLFCFSFFYSSGRRLAPPRCGSAAQPALSMTTPRVLAVHDLCSFGRCSLTAAIPVISAMGIQVCPFPTAWFSNNLTYGTYHFTDFTPGMTAFMDKWQSLGYSYDAIYSGFLADAGQVAVVCDAVRRFGREGSLIVVDPAMGDDGKLYPVFKPAFVEEMRKLVACATVITPNYTEACLLLDEPLPAEGELEAPDEAKLRRLFKGLAALGAKQTVITSVPAGEGLIKVASFDAASGAYVERTTKRIPFSTCGTGDLFTSVMTGAMLRGRSLAASAALAMDFASYVIDFTYRAGSDWREGVQLEPCLGRLIDMAAAPEGAAS